jgi:adenylosuccinate lyase
MAEFAWTLERASRRLRMFRHDIAVGKLSGPVGDFKRLTPSQEQKAMRSLNLGTAPVASQVVMRDVYADFVYGMAQVATAIEAIALEVRLSSRTDTGEVAESFTYGQRGSSSMPHKNNPVTSEKLCGLARIVRAQVDPVMQGVALHHERDISHSSVERIALETATILTAYMTRSCFNMLFNLDVRVDVMADRVNKSPQLMTAMAKDYLIENGVNPEVAWTLVANAYEDFRSGSVMEFDASLALNWASVNRHGPLPGLVEGWKPDFHGLLDLLDDPIRLVGNTRHVFADLESLVG